MNKYLCLILPLMVSLSACYKSSDDNKTIKNNYSLDSEPLAFTQWAMAYDQEYYQQHNIDMDAHVHADELLTRYTGQGVKIAVIDSSINADHIELESQIKSIASVHGEYSSSCAYPIDCTHGSAVAGIVAAKINQEGIRGFAPSADVYFIQMNLNSSVSDSEIIRAFELVEENNIDVVVCSWGTGDVSPAVAVKIQQLQTTGRDGKGIIIFFATGNNSAELPNDESMLSTVIGVGASDHENKPSSYNSFGQGLDLLAPGGRRFNLGISTISEQDGYYRLADDDSAFIGTSAAAPIAASLAALLLEANPNLTFEQIYSVMTESADKIGQRQYENGFNQYDGFGKVNFDQALNAMKDM